MKIKLKVTSNKNRSVTSDLSDCKETVRLISESIPEPILILGKDRKLTFYNKAAAVFFGTDGNPIGRLPGEFFNCSNPEKGHSQCGSTDFCRYCGAIGSITEALDNKSSMKECSILKINGDVLELSISTALISIDAEFHLLVFVRDISDSKRKAILERLFFHDIMNLLSGMTTISDILDTAESLEEVKELAQILKMASTNMTEEIRSYKVVLEAENGELEIRPEDISSVSLLEEMQTINSKTNVCHDKFIKIDDDSTDIFLKTDPTILKRVIGNLIKNALEAIKPGESVTIGSYRSGNNVVFRVANSGFIPENIQARLFHKNVSTKGTGRGLGTHSVRLLTEKYLKGHVSFTSTEKDGTVFNVVLPSSL